MSPPAAEPVDLPVPAALERRYDVVRVLGSGATGAVYEATDRITAERVALKVMGHAPTTWPPPAWRVLSRIDHPALPRLHAWGLDEGRPWVVRELARGVPLTELLGALDDDELFALSARLVSLLEHLHRNGVLHGDIKPDNIVVERDPLLGVWPRLIDFGLAIESSDPRSGEARGSIPWMAPELLAGQGVSVVSDRYALAASLFAAASGMPPYPADDQQLVGRIARREVLDRLDEVPVSLRAALSAALAGDPRPAAWHALCLAWDGAEDAPVRLVERDAEAGAVARITSALAPVGPGRILRFVGPVGSGRRTLARQAVSTARWSMAAFDVVPVASDVADIVPTLADALGVVADPDDLPGTIDAILDAARTRPTVALVTGAASRPDHARELRALDHSLARPGAETSLCVVVAFGDAVDSDAERGPSTDVVEVGALSEDEAVDVLRSAGIEDVAQLAPLLEACHGRVGYLRMLVHAARDLEGLPESLEDLAASRVDELSPDLRATLERIVGWGGPVDEDAADRLALTAAHRQALARAGLIARIGGHAGWRVADEHVHRIVKATMSRASVNAVLEALDAAPTPLRRVVALELATRIDQGTPVRIGHVAAAAADLVDARTFGRAADAIEAAGAMPDDATALEGFVDAWVRVATAAGRTRIGDPAIMTPWIAANRDTIPSDVAEAIELLVDRARSVAGTPIDLDRAAAWVRDPARPLRIRRLAAFVLCTEIYARGYPGLESSAEAFALDLTAGLLDAAGSDVSSPADVSLAIALGFARIQLLYDFGRYDAIDAELSRMRRFTSADGLVAARMRRQELSVDGARSRPRTSLGEVYEAIDLARRNGWLDVEVDLTYTLSRRADNARQMATRRDVARTAWQLGLRARRYDLVIRAASDLVVVLGSLGDHEGGRRLLDDLRRQLPDAVRASAALRIAFCDLVVAARDPDVHVWIETVERFEAMVAEAGIEDRLGAFVLFQKAQRGLFDGDVARIVSSASELAAVSSDGSSLRAWAHALLGWGSAMSRDAASLRDCVSALSGELTERRLVLWRDVLRTRLALLDGDRVAARRHGAAAVQELETLLEGLDAETRQRASAMPWVRAVTDVESAIWGSRDDVELVNGMRTILEISRETIFVGGNYERRLGEALRRIAEFAGAARGTVYRVADESDGTPTFDPALSWPDATHEVRASRTMLREVAEGRQTVLSPNALEDTRFSTAGSVLQLGLRSVLAIPLAVNDHLLGVVWLDHPDKVDQFTTTRRTLIELLAGQLAAILEEARGREDEMAVRADFPEIVGESPLLLQTLQRASKAAVTDSPVLILGETGTGKELLARGMHANSRRADGPFVPVNCAAIPEELFEAQLFGAARGAYTGSTRDREGLIEAASGGTLFLDEVGELPDAVQAKLLRVLEAGTWRRVGEVRERWSTARIIAATNRDLIALAGDGRFREDLYYRLAILSVTLPPLRDRPEDIPRLAGWYHRLFAERYGRDLEPLSTGVLHTLATVEWPGNVRQLRNVIEQSIVFADGNRIGADDILANIASNSDPRMRPTLARPVAFDAEMSFSDEVDGFKQWLAEQALALEDGNRTRAAKRLGINRRTLYKILPPDGDA